MSIWWSTEANNWDLHAVVRGCCFSGPTTDVDPFSSFPSPLLNEEDMDGGKDLVSFPDLEGAQTALHELEELCKPFFPKPQRQQLLSSQGISPSPSSSSDPAMPGPHRPLSQTPPRSKRRKNQQKRVVFQVPADGVSHDLWAWRKYGQKPIKGSPYPRGYYRCSSSKACLGRKQVERSRTDPSMLVITYTAEHNHPVPTHRNSLAGSTRNKLPPPPSASAQPADTSPAASGGGGGLSPTTPLMASMEDELLRRRRPRKGDAEEDEGDGGEEEEEGSLPMGDMEMMGEDEMLFVDLEELGEPTTITTTTDLSVDTTFLEDDGDFAHHFFTQPWQVYNNAADGR